MQKNGKNASNCLKIDSRNTEEKQQKLKFKNNSNEHLKISTATVVISLFTCRRYEFVGCYPTNTKKSIKIG